MRIALITVFTITTLVMGHPINNEVANAIRQVFRKVISAVDMNIDGRITEEDIDLFIENVGTSINDTNAESLVDKVDIRGQGQITFHTQRNKTFTINLLPEST
ncbi:unnamed protein product [Dicrocoelium dendriticum]|nr:unnamed protein product [Dicrocoelium dendriticum]